ncbi:MAG: hypothetical protein CMI86_00225 [Candidatus Pelagibacter sp.]|nr:hypothetical protein [Candidatus Pelagibacter sp.]|tara:strand:- start:3054 stop:3662 length:609 start_codon:yes stop_codon:yes gene_type:complete
MNNKTWLQIFVIFLIVLISIFISREFFFKKSYIEETEILINEDRNFENIKSNEIEKEVDKDLIENLRYRSIDSLGNEYLINCKSAVTNSENENILELREVNAIIFIKNKKPIFINSDYASYDKISFDTNFYGNVKIVHDKINSLSGNLDLIYQKNLVNLYNIKKFFYGKTILEADKINFDLLTKDINVNMDEVNKKIKLNYR